MLVIPPRLAEILQPKPSLNAAIQSALDGYSSFLEVSRLPFFPDFTDHGPTHIQSVLGTCDWLIPNASAEILSPEDVAALTLAVLFHDLGMHLTKDGFQRLLAEPLPKPTLPELDQRTWQQLWDDFCLEAKRFTPKQSQDIFGTPDDVLLPSTNADAWDEKQFLLVGEFIRRHHPRLAHEIAVVGFPTTIRSPRIELPSPLRHLADLAGLIARSHGLPLRKAVDLTAEKYDNAVHPLNVHVAYLMAVLRMADYLQIEADRAPDVRLRVQSLRSPVSINEWQKHQAILNVEDDTRGTEGKFIRVRPVDSAKLYFDLQNLFTDMQRELDASWVTVNEIYGHQASQLGLRIRRFRSSLDEPRYQKDLPFISRLAKFQANESSLLPKLIGPLYRGEPKYGVRELLQNAVDAVSEFEASCKYPGRDLTSIPRATLREAADVVISVDSNPDGTGTFVIEDRGTGMTVDTVINYFLTAGSSFRDSPLWRRDFLDDIKQATVVRSGRFGVGALAAFLLGDRVSVSTRHFTADDGIQFECDLQTAPIDLRRCDRPVGTTIKVALASKTLQALVGGPATWDWFWWSAPRVARFIDGTLQPMSPVDLVPRTSDDAFPHWACFQAGTQTIFWRPQLSQSIFCNGIFVDQGSGGTRSWGDSGREDELQVNCPDLAITDPDGVVPLDLSRMRFLWDGWSAADLLYEEIVRDCAASLLVLTPAAPPWEGGSLVEQGVINLIQKPDLAVLYWPTGVSLGSPQLVEERSGYMLALNRRGRLRSLDFVKEHRIEFPVGIADWVHQPHPRFGSPAGRRRFLSSHGRKANFGLLQSTDFGKARDSHLNGSLGAINIGEVIEELYWNPEERKEPSLAFFNDVFKILGDPIVPYSMERRRETHATAYRELAPYIRRWEALAARKRKP